MHCSRRDLLKWGAAATAVWGTTSPFTQAVAQPHTRRKPRIALQLYSVRKECEKDLPGVLKAVAKMGYHGVEFAGYYGHTAGELKKLLDASGLKCCGTHLQLSTLLGDDLARTVEFNKTIGNRYLIVSYMGEDRMGTAEKAEATAKLFTELSEKVKNEKAGGHSMRVGYHAHGGDFRKFGDKTAWEVFFSHAGPRVVMQLDIGNCLGAGGDPYAILKEFPGRAATIHLKEHGGKPGAVIGEGEVKWPEIFRLCETIGRTRWYIVEQESYAGGPLDAVKGCIENMRKMGRA